MKVRPQDLKVGQVLSKEELAKAKELLKKVYGAGGCNEEIDMLISEFLKENQ